MKHKDFIEIEKIMALIALTKQLQHDGLALIVLRTLNKSILKHPSSHSFTFHCIWFGNTFRERKKLTIAPRIHRKYLMNNNFYREWFIQFTHGCNFQCLCQVKSKKSGYQNTTPAKLTRRILCSLLLCHCGPQDFIVQR